jgi:4-amino-4-deoxy-L-arabinose transferase-like glycosyltransferase
MPRLTRVHRIILCAGTAALIYFAGLGRPALWEPDEGRYAEIAREMVVSGDYVTPRNDWVRYFEKPPLVYWSTAAAIKVLGRNEFAVRFQAALASVGSVAVTEALGEAMFGAAAGIFAAFALGLSPLFFIFARFATPDPALTFFFTAALSMFFLAARDGHFQVAASRRRMLIAAALLAFGTLVKGPVALVLGGGIAGLWLLAEGRARDLVRIRWLECIAIYMLIVAPWFTLAAMRNPGFLRFFFVHEHFQRFVADTEHGWGPWFFIPIVIAGAWPWLYFVPSGAVDLRNTGLTRLAESPARLRFAPPGADDVKALARRSGVRFLLIWFAVVFIFFSIPRAKLGEYVLPAMPPLAILAGAGLMRLHVMELRRVQRTLGWFAVLNLSLMLVAVAVATLWRSGLAGRSPLVAPLVGDGALLAVAWGIGALTIYLGTRVARSAGGAPWGVAIVALISAGILAKARSDATATASYRELSSAIAPYLHDGCTLAAYHHFVQAIPFYTEARERLVGYRGELAPFGDTPDAANSFVATDQRLGELWSAPRCVILIANRTDVVRLESWLKPPPASVGSEGKKIALINTRRSAAEPSKRVRELR